MNRSEVGQRRFSLAEGARNSLEDIEGKKDEAIEYFVECSVART